MSYKDDLSIDKYILDEEWQEQPKKFAEWAEKEVEASFIRDKAKERLDLVKAELDSRIRSEPFKYGIDKVTESSIQNTILRQQLYMEASEALIVATRDVKILNVAREAFDHRKKALEKMTDLFLSNYWADKGGERLEKAVDKIDRDGVQEAFQTSMKIRRRNSNG